MDEYHHYIPQFILRNFSIHKKVKNKKNIKIKYYNIKNNKLESCKTQKIYGVYNLYKNLNIENVMEVEKELGNNKYESIFQIKIKEVDDEIVHLINSIFLEEENESITFVSDDNLYESIKFYENCKELLLQKNYKNLKNILTKTFNNNEIIYKIFPYNEKINRYDIFCVLNYNNQYLFKEIVKEVDNEIKDINIFWNILENNLPSKVSLSEGIVVKLKNLIEKYLLKISTEYNTYSKDEIANITKFIHIRFVLLICNNMNDNNIINIKYISDFYNVVYETSDKIIERISILLKPYNENILFCSPENNIEENLIELCIKHIICMVGFNLYENNYQDIKLNNIFEKYKIAITSNIKYWLSTERPDIIFTLSKIIKDDD
jgi:hypothetical protein